jgi:hypothetical protein
MILYGVYMYIVYGTECNVTVIWLHPRLLDCTVLASQSEEMRKEERTSALSILLYFFHAYRGRNGGVGKITKNR